MTLYDHLARFEAARKTTGGVPQITVALRTIIARFQLIQLAWRQFNAGVTQKIEFPYSEVLITINAIQDLILYAFEKLDIPYDLVVDLRGARRALLKTRARRDLFEVVAQRNEGFNTTFSSSRSSKKLYVIQYGDSMRSIASRMLKDSTRWAELIELNALVFPYVVNSAADKPAGKKVLVPGDILVVPDDAIEQGNAVLSESPNSYATLLGRDIFAGQNGRLEFYRHGDLRLVEGVDNILQATRNRLLTDTGEILLHPDYGANLKALIGREGTPPNVALAGLEVSRSLNDEPRFTRVGSVKVSFASTVITITFDAFVINKESVSPFNLVINRPLAA